MSTHGLTDKEIARIERGFVRTRRAWEVLDLVVAEFETDPMSVQCFNLRIVEEAKQLVKMQRAEARCLEPLAKTNM